MRETKFEKQVRRDTALKIFMDGKKCLFMIPCKCFPSTWMPFYDVLPEEGRTKEDFERLVNAFEYYNCNKETGKRAAFYISKSYGD